MPSTTVTKSSTPVSTISSLATNHTTTTATTAVQSGPYTKAQFHNTMEGSRSIKNAKEVEKLLGDYPAALELYRTGKYKVKVKYEADVERVILVEKRTIKGTSNDTQQNKQSVTDTATNLQKTNERVSKEKDSGQTRSRTISRDRAAPTASATNGNALVNTTTSSVRVQNNSQPKVDHHPASLKERETSVVSQPKQQHANRSHSRESPSAVSHTKQQGKISHKGQSKMIVPFVPNANPTGKTWHQSRAVQPYYSNPMLQQQQQQQQQGNMYMPSAFGPQQNQLYQQPYFYGQQPLPALTYQNHPGYPTSSTIKSTGNIRNKTLHSTYNYPSSSWAAGNPNHGANLPPSFHTFHPNQQQFIPPNAMYQSQMPAPWSATTNAATCSGLDSNGVCMNNQRSSKHRARSVDTGPRGHPPVRSYKQQQSGATVVEHHHHRHHHHHRAHPTNAQTNPTGPPVEIRREQNGQFKETTTAVNTGTNGEKVTIRQLNEIFTKTDPSGRLAYNVLPAILQRFGISLTENDVISAARDLGYNVTEPISARRLVHVLVKLGKIAKSTHHQRQQPSPLTLPEDREVTDIMKQRKLAGTTSTHIHSSAHPNHWH